MEDKKTFLKKWINGTLDAADEKKLLKDPAVERRMRSQWERWREVNPPEAFVGKRIWKKIEHRIERPAYLRLLRLYKTVAVAASLLLAIAVGGWIYTQGNRTPFYTYIITSGLRCIESVSLPDGTQVRMGPNSRLTYPQSFQGKTREVTLAGQAFFSVAKNKDKPFIVRTKSMDVTALGTAFEVFDYAYENRSEALLLEGKVRIDVGPAGSGAREEVVLMPNERLTYDKQDDKIQVKTVEANTSAGWWEEGVLSFENERLSRILSRLEPWFGQKITCPETIADTYRFTFKVRDESLERILFILSNASPVKYRETTDGYELYIDKNN